MAGSLRSTRTPSCSQLRRNPARRPTRWFSDCRVTKMTKPEISIPKVIVGLAVVMLISAAGSGAETPTRLTEVAVSAINGATYVMVTTGGTAKYHAKLVDPRRLVIDFEDTRYQWRTAPCSRSGDPR